MGVYRADRSRRACAPLLQLIGLRELQPRSGSATTAARGCVQGPAVRVPERLMEGGRRVVAAR